MNTHPKPKLQPELNKEGILDQLFRLADKYGLDVELIDIEDMLGQDDNDFLGNLATLAAMHDIDHEDFFIDLGIPQSLIIDAPNHLEITDGTE